MRLKLLITLDEIFASVIHDVELGTNESDGWTEVLRRHIHHHLDVLQFVLS